VEHNLEIDWEKSSERERAIPDCCERRPPPPEVELVYERQQCGICYMFISEETFVKVEGNCKKYPSSHIFIIPIHSLCVCDQ